jgi:hypothetical protein
MVPRNKTSPTLNLIRWFLVIKLLTKIVGSSLLNIITWGKLVVDTPAALLSSMIPWKVVLEYQLSNIKTKIGIFFGLLKILILVIIYNID